MKVGDTFLSGSPGSWETKHLWVAITSPDATGHLVIVNVTSQGSDKDQSCVLSSGDHPLVSRESVINYASAYVVENARVDRALAGNAMQSQDPMPRATLTRMQSGALASIHTELGIKRAVRAELGI